MVELICCMAGEYVGTCSTDCFSVIVMHMKLFRKKKEFVLMHRKTPVILFAYDSSSHEVTSIIETYNPMHLPIGIQKGGKIQITLFNRWMKERMIPETAYGLQETLSALSVSSRNDLLMKAYGISLCDTYWFVENGQHVNWMAVSPYHHDYDLSGFKKARFTGESQPASTAISPSIMLSGNQKKAWVKENGLFLLDKGSDDPYHMDPIHHWLAGRIAGLLDLHACRYELEIVEGQLISVSPCFTKEHTDAVTVQSVLSSVSSRPYQLSIDAYIHSLEEHGIKDVKKKISDMLLLDYLLLKPDRKLTDMAVEIDARNGQWLDPVPAYSFSHTLGSLIPDADIENYDHHATCNLFNASSLSFESLLPYIRFDDYDFSVLKQIPLEYGNQLVEYRELTGMNNHRIELQYQLIYNRIRSVFKAARIYRRKLQ